MRFTAGRRLRGALVAVLPVILALALTPAATAAPETRASAPAATVATVATVSAASTAAHPTPLPQGTRGFDTAATLSATTLNCLVGQGYRFVLLNTTGDVNVFKQNYADRVAAGLSVLLFQGYDESSFADPSAAAARASILLNKAATVGYPRGAQLFLDLEHNITRTTVAQQIAWVRSWSATVTAAGYRVGVYVGAPQRLRVSDFQELNLPDVSVYWQSQSSSAPEPLQGDVATQALPSKVCGVLIDVDTARTDAYGNGLTGSDSTPVLDRNSPGVGIVNAPGGSHVFAVSADHQLTQVVSAGAGWRAPETLGGSVAGTPAVLYRSDGRYDVFVLGINSVVYQISYAGGRWSGFTPITGPGFAGGVSAVRAADGRIHLFAVNVSHQLVQVVGGTTGGPWSAQTLGGAVAGAPAAIYQGRPNRYDVFVLGLDGRMNQFLFSGGWRAVGPVSPAVFVGGVGAVLADNGEYHLFAETAGGRLAQLVWARGWRAPEDFGGALMGSPGVSYVGGRYDVIAVGVRGPLYDKVYSGGWRGFAAISGALFI